MSKKELKTNIDDAVVQEDALEETLDNDETLDEATAAADTLKPGAKSVSDPKSRIEMMSSVISAMGGMPKKDLVKWFDQQQAVFGPGKTYGVGDNSEQNKSTINAKPSAAGAKGADVKMPMQKITREDVSEIFGGEELTEEFKEKATTLFEAAVHARVVAEVARLEEEYENTLEEQIATVTTELSEKLDSYLDYVVENWMNENEVAIETSLRNELVDDFIESLKNVFAEHYIDVPAEKLDVLDALAEKVEELESKLDKTITENSELKKIAVATELEKTFDEIAEGLVMSQVENFRTLSESVEFDGDITAYKKKLNTIKEAHFKEKTPKVTLVSEAVDLDEDENPVQKATTPEMRRYADAISRTVKR
jgi:hypothetical protein